MPSEITEAEFDRTIKSAEHILIDAYATWCPPCQAIAQILEEIERAGIIKIFKLNIDNAPRIASKYNIFNVPTLIIFAGGKEIDRSIGLTTKEKLIAWIREAKKKT